MSNDTELDEGRSPGNDDAHRFMLKDKISQLEKEGKPATAQKNRLQTLLAKRKAEKRGIVTEEGGRWVYDNNGKAREISAAEAAATRKAKVAARESERIEQDKADERAADRRGGYGKGLEEDVLLEVKPNKVTKPVHTHSIAGNMSHEDKKQEVSLGMSQSGRPGWFTNNMMAISLSPEEHAKFSKDPVAAKAHAAKFGFKLKEEVMTKITESTTTIGSPRTGITADLLDQVGQYEVPVDPTDTVTEVNTYTAASMTKLAGWQDNTPLDEGMVKLLNKVRMPGEPFKPLKPLAGVKMPGDPFKPLKPLKESIELDEGTKPKVIPLGSDRHPAADPSHPNHAEWKAAKPKSVRKPTAADMFKTPRVSAHEKPISAEDAFNAVKKEGIGEADHTVYAHNVVHMHNGKKVAAKHIGTYHSINGAKDMGFEHDDPNAGDTEEIFHHIVHRDSENPRKLHVYQTGHAKNWHGIDEEVELESGVFELDEASSYSRENQYGLRHREWKGKQGGGTLTTIESWHKSPEARDKHRAKVEQKDGFHEFVSTSNPRTNEDVELDEAKKNITGYGVYLKGGPIGTSEGSDPMRGKLFSTHTDELEAKAKATRLHKTLSKGEKGYYGMKFHVKPIYEETELDENRMGPAALGFKVPKSAADPGKERELRKQEKSTKVNRGDKREPEFSQKQGELGVGSRGAYGVRVEGADFKTIFVSKIGKAVADPRKPIAKTLEDPFKKKLIQNEEVELDEISQKTATNVYANRATDEFEDDGFGEYSVKSSEPSGNYIKKKFGDDAMHHADKAADTKTFGRKDASGQRKTTGYEPLRKQPKPRIRKDGKINKSDTQGLKWEIKNRVKAGFHKKVGLPEETELNEGDLRLVSIYKNKAGESHTLWQTGQYEYHMTPSKQSTTGHFPKTKTWNKSLEDVHKELGENGFKIHHTPLSA